MEPLAAKAVSVAPDDELKVKQCDSCRTTVEDGVERCPSCGSPTSQLPLLEDLSDPVQAGLARANLLRLRHQYDDAQGQCIEILKNFPHNLEAHELLGDISSEQRAYDQAEHWYELALDLSPDSAVIREKLARASERLHTKSQDETVSQLGLPSTSTAGPAIIAVVVLVIILISGAFAYSLGKKSALPTKSVVIDEGVQATQDMVSTKFPPVTAGTEPAPQPKAVVGNQEDLELLARVRIGSYGSRISEAMQDQRGKHVIVTFRLEVGENERKVGSEVAREVINAVSDSPLVIVRGVRDGHLIYMADVSRSRLAETQTTAWQQGSDDPDAWMAYVVANEWYGQNASGEHSESATKPESTP
ncbi:hypothetical protein BH11ARM1_BH11ARM1_06650 [soil metagenome]